MAQYILAYLSEDCSAAHVEALSQVAESLARERVWSRGVPQFVDDVDDSSRTQPEDSTVRTVGVQLLVSEPGEHPPTPVDEPTRLLEALAKFSGMHALALEVQYGHEVIGAIVNGVMDTSLRKGFLDAW